MTFGSFCRRLFELTANDSRNWIASAEVDSTNSQGRRILERCRSAGMSPVPPCCFVAWSQSQGRGRGNRSWISSPGLGLYMTFVLGGLAPESLRQMPMAVAILVARTLRSGGLEPRIKWPNDIHVRGRKLAGILLEASSRGGEAVDALVGIGINVHHTGKTLPFPEATSLAREGVSGRDMAQLAFAVAAGVTAFETSKTSLEEVVEEYRSWSQHAVGDRLRCRRGKGFVEGDFAGFDEDGSLLLALEGRTLKLSSSEILEG